MSSVGSTTRLLGISLLASVLASCSTEADPTDATASEPTVVRVLTFQVPVGWDERWREACRQIAAAAGELRLDANWLLHHAGSGSYYLVTFGSLADFERPGSVVDGFARHDADLLSRELERLHAIPYRVVSDEIWEQNSSWSTATEMNSLTHPGVDQRTYYVRAGRYSEVDSVLSEMAALLDSERFPYPTEAFRIAHDGKVIVQVVTFFGERSDYRATDQPAGFLAARNALPRWLDLQARLDAATHDNLRRESWFVYEESYDPWLAEQIRETGD